MKNQNFMAPAAKWLRRYLRPHGINTRKMDKGNLLWKKAFLCFLIVNGYGI